MTDHSRQDTLNSSFCSSSYTVKMATKVISLLSPRPHIPGVGRRHLHLSSNIFMELMQLSPLLNSSLEQNGPDTKSYNPHHQCLTQKTEEPNGINRMNENKNFSDADVPSCSLVSLQNNSKENQKEITNTAKNIPNQPDNEASKQLLKNLGEVIDRDEQGLETLVKYNFNKNTLRMFDILQSLNIPSQTEIYKPKEKRSCVEPSIFYCKNLFLKDRKGQYFLVICHEDTDMDLKYLRKAVKAYRNFNFVSADEMKVLLGTDPGGVTPLALMFANALEVSMVISKTLYKDGASLMFHPLDSHLATKISLPSLLRFLKYVGHSVIIVD